MPIFEFQCEKCGKSFEKIIYGTPDMDILFCPDCGSRRIMRKLSSFGISAGQAGSGRSNASCGKTSFT